MKRVISMIVVAGLALSMCACGSTNPETSSADTQIVADTTLTESTANPENTDGTAISQSTAETAISESADSSDVPQTSTQALETSISETPSASSDTTVSAVQTPQASTEVGTTATSPRVTSVTTPDETTSAPETTPATESEYADEMQRQYAEKSDKLQKLYTSISSNKDMPVINITTLDESRILSKDEYVTSVIDVFNCDDKYELTACGGVKVRGNSTAEQGSEKPYRIKFDKKQGMLGLHDGVEYKSWVLLRSYWNLAPDYMAFSLAREIYDGKYYSSDCAYVNLYLNGKYAGMYLLCEQNQANSGRIEVYEPNADEERTDIGYLLELDNYASEEHPFFTLGLNNETLTDINGVTRAVEDRNYSVKSDINTDEQLEFISKYTRGVFKIIYEAVSNEKPMMFDENNNVVSAEGTYSPKEAVEAVLDTEAAADMLILQELVHNYDVGAGSFYMAVDFSSKSKYKKLTFLAPWDFNWAYYDSAYGQYYAGTFQNIMMDYERSNYWLIMLMKADWFVDTVKDRWNSLYGSGTLSGVTSQVRADVELLRNDLGDNEWQVNSALELADFVDGRIKWLNKQWGK